MSSTFENDQDQAALTALDARKSVGQEESTAPENASSEMQQSAFDSDSDCDLQDDEDDELTPISDTQENRAYRAEGEGGGNADDSWLGAALHESPPPDNSDPPHESTPPRRPHDLILDYAQKRSRDVYEPEDQLSPQVSPRTRKRLRTERERGYAYEDRPRALFSGAQDGRDDPVGEIILNHYRRDNTWNRPEYIKGRPVGQVVPEFPNLPNRPSPLGREAHSDGKWMGLLTVPDPPMPPRTVEEERTASPPMEGEGYEDELEEDDDCGALPLRPSTPGPDYEADEGTDLHAGIPAEGIANADDDRGDDRDDDAFREPAVTFEEALAMGAKVDWADDDDDEEFLRAFTESPSVTTGATVGEEPVLASAEHTEFQQQGGFSASVSTIRDAGCQAQEDVQREAEQSTVPGDRDAAFEVHDDEIEPAVTLPEPTPSTTSIANSPLQQPTPSPQSILHPSHRENGREVGKFSAPAPRDDELNRLRLLNAKITLQNEETRRRGNAAYQTLHNDHLHLERAHRNLLSDLNGLREIRSDLEQDYTELRDECREIRQRAEYDAKLLADARAQEDAERLALITSLTTRANRMQKWAETLDADMEPLRSANETLQHQIQTLQTQLQEAGERGLAMAALYREAQTRVVVVAAAPVTATATTTTCSSTPFSTSPRPTPSPFTAPQETPEARETRWRNLGAHHATRNATRTAQGAADEQYAHDRETRLQTIDAAKRRFAREIAAAQHAVNAGHSAQIWV